MEKALIEASEAAQRFGVNTSIISNPDKTPVVYLGDFSGESLTLGKAILEISNAVRVIFSYYDETGTQGFLEIKGNKLLPAQPFNITYFHNEQYGITLDTGNAQKIQIYTEDKFLTHFILSRNGISVPKQRKLPANLSIDDIKGEFPSGSVIKGRMGCGGSNVRLIRDYEREKEISGRRSVIEELIESYPITIEKRKMDWNLRVLVSYDPTSGKYKTVGIVGRIDNEGGPVNISLSADNISFEHLAILCGWDENEQDSIEKQVKEIAEKSCEVLVQVGNRKGKIPNFINVQTVFGVDIIIDKNKNPIVIEVNNSDSGCIFELGKLEGIKSIYPIATAILYKVQAILFYHNIGEIMANFSRETGISLDEIAEKYNSGKMKIKIDLSGDYEITLL